MKHCPQEKGQILLLKKSESLNHKLCFSVFSSPPMTPDKVAQCVQNIWENEKLLFSEHLAMVFPSEYTSTLLTAHKG